MTDPTSSPDPQNEALEPPHPAIWSGAQTTWWGLAIIAVFFAVQIVIGIGIAIVLAVNGELDRLSDKTFFESGFVLALSTCLTNPVVIACCFFLAWFRRGMPTLDYLGIVWVPIRRQLRWLGIGVVVVALCDLATWATGRPIVPEVMVDAYRTAGFLPLLWITLVIMAPFFEELFFRGFLFRGWEASRLGAVGTILLTSALWAVIHVQYELWGIGQIFVVGLLLGVIRWRTQSVVPAILLHSLMNVVATLQIIIYLSLQGEPVN